ncbi:MAG: hydantoinase/oxoprolinase family protein [Alphaproteobacteria bacterium]
MGWFIGVDVGGTFTDFFAFDDATGTQRLFKTPSTPADPAAAILAGLDALCAQEGIPAAAIRRLAHGTTVATNALIQGRGGRVAFVTTAGFRDLLEIGRQTRPRMYDLKADFPPPVVPRERRFEVVERLDAKGRVLTPLTDAAVDAAVAAVRDSGAEACAVGLLFSFLDPAHEQRLGEALKAAMPDLFVTLSSAVRPEFREYERFSTAALNAYLQPVVARYMTRLGDGLRRRMPQASVGINQSAGGLMSVERARDFPIRTALSGPAAGAMGAVAVARQTGHRDVITLDMGGTSADVCLIRDLDPGVGHEQEVAGFPVRLPMVDVNTVGAGGGSIAWFERDGLMKVGPLSAGAQPGPACYGRGGTEATVTDANLVLGRLSPQGLLGGGMPLDLAAAERAIRPVADRIGFSLHAAAQGILDIAAANMVRAIRTVSVERGHDPRLFALMAFGGAGPLHARAVARALDIRTVIVPVAPGILCAEGLVVSDLKEEFVAGGRLPLASEALGELAARSAMLWTQAEDWFAAEGVAVPARDGRLAFDMRYVGQNFEISVPVATARGGVPPQFPDAAALRDLFFAAHEQSYGFHNPQDAVEVVTIRLTALGRLRHPEPVPRDPAGSAATPSGRRPVWYGGTEPVDTPVYARATLAPGHVIEGPAVIEQLDSTTILYPGDGLRVTPTLHLLLEVGP